MPTEIRNEITSWGPAVHQRVRNAVPKRAAPPAATGCSDGNLLISGLIGLSENPVKMSADKQKVILQGDSFKRGIVAEFQWDMGAEDGPGRLYAQITGKIPFLLRRKSTG